jgi:hypothetical protein
VEIEKEISAESGKISIRWELSPRITVDTSMGEMLIRKGYQYETCLLASYCSIKAKTVDGHVFIH